MFERLENSWELVKASGRVLQADKELLVFPFFSGIAVLLVTVSFFVPLYFLGIVAKEGGALSLGAYAGIFLFYFVQYFIVIFFNSGLVGAALIRLDGGDPTVGDGFRIASQNLGSILLYALIAASVGMVLRMIKERAGILGRLLASFGGLAWSLVTFLVIPVLVTKGLGPVEAIKESGRIFRQTWGEQIAGKIGIGFFFGVVTVLYALVAIPCIVLVAVSGDPGLPLILVVAAVVIGFVLLSLISSALSGIYSAALYRFATTGRVAMFEERLLRSAFK
jgi:hypothetical protein